MANVPEDSKEYFVQSQLPPPEEPTINIVPSPTGSQVEDGSLRSPNYRPGSSGWSINSDGTAEFVGLEATNVKIIQGLPIAETMSAGTPVGVDWEGKIARAMRNFQDDATGQFSFSAIKAVFPYSKNKFVVVYYYMPSSTWYLYAVLATVSSTTNDVSFGTPTQVEAFGGDNLETSDVCQVDTGTFVAIYGELIGSETVYGRAFTFDGTSFTVGAQKTITTTDNIDETACCKSDTNEFVWCGYRDTFGDWEIGYATVSGTTITLVSSNGTSLPGITDSATKDIRLSQVGTGKVAILNAPNGYIAIGTTDGSMVTGTPVSTGSTGTRDTSSIVSLTDDTFYLHNGTSIGYFTISGTVPSLEGSLVTRTGSQGGLVEVGTSVYDFNSYPTDDKDAGIWSVVSTGSTPTITQLNATLKKAGVISNAVSYDGYRIFALASDLSYWLSSMSYNFIGILEDGGTNTSGQNGRVIIRGVADGLSGLISGSYYLVSNGTLTRISPTETVNTLDDVVNVVKAISSTQILI